MKKSVASKICRKTNARMMCASGLLESVIRKAVLLGSVPVLLMASLSAHAQTAVLEYLFDETATIYNRTAENTGSTSGNDLIMRNSSGSYTDLHGAAGSGVSGALGDLSFNNTGATGMGSGYAGGYASGSVTVGELTAFTLTGWFKTDGSIIGNGATLIEGGGIKLSGISSDGRLSLNVNGASVVSNARYNAQSEWVFFAISYDSSVSTDNVYLYVGDDSTSSSLARFQTATVDGGSVTISNSTFIIGGHYQANPFDGEMDDFRVFNSVLSQSELETVRQGDIFIPESGATSVALGALAISLVWAYKRRR